MKVIMRKEIRPDQAVLLHLIVSILLIEAVTGISSKPTETTACSSQTANIEYNISLDTDEDIIGIRIYYFRGSKIAENDGNTLTPEHNYSSRLVAFGTYGISLSSVSNTDAGMYLYAIVVAPKGAFFTATATLSVQVAPTKNCSVTTNQTANIAACFVNTENCGTSEIVPDWLNFTGTSNTFACTGKGTYRCCASGAALTNCYSGNDDHFCAMHTCTYGPDTGGITLAPSQTYYEPEENTSFSVNCTADCYPICHYNWSGPGGDYQGHMGMLSIPHISRKLTGVFICTAINPRNLSNSVSVNISVIVSYGPDMDSIILSPNETVIERAENTSLSVNCSAECSPSCQYIWTGPGGNFPENAGTLFIAQIHRMQAGVFMCIATNSRIETKVAIASTNVTVIYGPDIDSIALSPSQISYEPEENTTLLINCSADCYPRCQYNWSGPVGNYPGVTGILSIPRIQKYDTGVFKCTATNLRIWPWNSISVTVNVTVLYPPMLIVTANNTTRGGLVKLGCIATGVPGNYTFYKWFHVAPDKGRTLVRELEGRKLSESEVSLQIEGGTYQDSGVYACRVSNGIKQQSTGQSIVEVLVFVWITDHPIIVSNATYFYAAKGESGDIYIELYSGFDQPIISWYRVKNGTAEMIQNSHYFNISVSTVTVELQYYQKTIRVTGYNSSLAIDYVDEEDFTSYKVVIYNSLLEPVNKTIYLMPRGPPETPTSFSVANGSVTAHSLQLTWRSGFHNGAPQTFVILYRIASETNWMNKSESHGLVQLDTLSTTITNLKEGTSYQFKIYSENIFNRSPTSPTINETTKTVKHDELVNTEGSPVVIGLVSGSALILMLAVAVVAFLLYKRRQTTKSPEEGLVPNPVYDCSGPLHDPSSSGDVSGADYTAAVNINRKAGHVDDPSEMYAQVVKTRKERKMADVYENAKVFERSARKCSTCETNESTFENTKKETSKESTTNADGFVYADLMLDPPTFKNGKPIVRGLENRTDYAEIAYGKRGDPLRNSEEETRK